MTPEPLDVAIIGAGTAGLSARSEVAKVTDSYRVFDPGPYGTTCARSACMPSKAFIQSAHDFHRRHAFGLLGIVGGESLDVDSKRVLAETRRVRDGLVDGVIEGMRAWRESNLVPHQAVFEAKGVLRAGQARFQPRATVIATGSRPRIPKDWHDKLGDRLLTSDDLFELPELPQRLAIIGLGPVGLELGQAFARLGVQVTGFDPSPSIGGVADPDLQSRLREALAAEMTIIMDQAEPVHVDQTGIRMRWNEGETEVDYVLAAMGRVPNLDRLGLDVLGVDLGETGRPDLPEDRLDLPGTRLYFAGDSGPGPALLHEASDEGRIAGYFAARAEDAVFRRRTPLRLVFCDPQIAHAGESWDTLEARADGVAIGEATFDRSGRTRLQRGQGGVIRIYAEKATGRLLGAAIVAPEAEHLAHLLAYAVSRDDGLKNLLRMPSYHPTHEEVLRRALRATLRNCDVDVGELEAIRCKDAPVDCDNGQP
ncbi:dihydrolipoyl dehydrogenase [Ruegeria marina]|uniref:Dihydrolipoamide dehydrogenase n=1 Tax=Ruegeria marina TaxID=639004 RepID=A0A1G6I5Y1_9RHOB|nr:dihydrolipoyl dehydrogenase [Ruegeria marina]SDC01904.1 dihydrolipoamide dehydrogenase [Ruegeria marina]